MKENVCFRRNGQFRNGNLIRCGPRAGHAPVTIAFLSNYKQLAEAVQWQYRSDNAVSHVAEPYDNHNHNHVAGRDGATSTLAQQRQQTWRLCFGSAAKGASSASA